MSDLWKLNCNIWLLGSLSVPPAYGPRMAPSYDAEARGTWAWYHRSLWDKTGWMRCVVPGMSSSRDKYAVRLENASRKRQVGLYLTDCSHYFLSLFHTVLQIPWHFIYITWCKFSPQTKECIKFHCRSRSKPRILLFCGRHTVPRAPQELHFGSWAGKFWSRSHLESLIISDYK